MSQPDKNTIDRIRMNARITSGVCVGLITIVFTILVVYADMLSDDPNTLMISEVCTQNDTTAHDEVGNYGADYIEIYNGTDAAINLQGYGLSDSRSNLYRFVLPDVTIAAHSAIVVWCNPMEQDLTQYAEDYTVRDIRGAVFSISSKGENIYLTDPNGVVVDEITVIADIPNGYSYQTALEDPDDYIIGEPTLYTVATQFDEITVPVAYTLNEPTFSVDGGWYDAPIAIELSCTRGEIYYTVDGSEPNENSAKYDQPITITNRSGEPNIWAAVDTVSTRVPYIPEEPVDKCTVIKAVAIDGEDRSDVSVRSYFVGLDDASYDGMAIVSLTMDPEDLFDYTNGIYTLGTIYDRDIEKRNGSSNSIRMANYAMEGRGWEREAQIEFYTDDHEEVLRQEIGVRIHGGVSVANNQKSYNLYVREEYDGNHTFLYDFWGKSHSRLMLQTGGAQDTYVTKFRDIFIQSLVTDRNIGCQQAIPCVVFLNGEYWGLYNLQEQANEDYIQANYGYDAEGVVVLKNPWEVAETDPDAQDYMDLVSYADSHDMSDDEQFAWIEERMDIQSYIDYWCTEIYVANCDSIINNYAIWRSRKVIDDEYGDGRWRWLLYDMEGAAGMFEEYSEADTDSFTHMHSTNNLLGEHDDALFSSLIRNDRFKELFAATFLEMADTNFAYEYVHEQLYEMAEEYCDAVVASHQRFRGDYTPDSYKAGSAGTTWYTEDDYWSDIKVIDDFFRDRREYIVAYMYQNLGIE